MKTKDKQQVIFRLDPYRYDLLKAKISQDEVTLQKVFDLWVDAYVRGDKELMKYVYKAKNDKGLKKKRYSLSYVESLEIFNKIEQISPVQDAREFIDELAKQAIENEQTREEVSEPNEENNDTQNPSIQQG